MNKQTGLEMLEAMPATRRVKVRVIRSGRRCDIRVKSLSEASDAETAKLALKARSLDCSPGTKARIDGPAAEVASVIKGL